MIPTEFARKHLQSELEKLSIEAAKPYIWRGFASPRVRAQISELLRDH